MKQIITILFLFVLSLMLAGCTSLSDGQQSDQEQDLTGISTAIVSILPQKEFVQEVGGERVVVHSMIPEGGSPATYDPLPSDLVVIEEADLYFRIGHIPFEETHIPTIRRLNPEMDIIDTSEQVDLRYFGEAEEHTHEADDHHETEDDHSDETEDNHVDENIEHDNEHAKEEHHDEHNESEEEHQDEHDHRGVDPHIWLSPVQVTKQVDTIADALADHDPENADYYYQNAASYTERLMELHEQIRDQLSGLEERTLLVFHPAWGYFADAYNLTQVAIEQDGKEPTAEELQNIIRHAKETETKVIFVQAQFSTTMAESIAEEIDGAVISINPLAEDYLANMQLIVQTISETLNN